QVTQNVTMFPVEVNILNPGHLLKPGMNTEVEIQVGSRQGVLAVPNAALRTLRNVASAAQVLGLDPKTVQQQLGQTEAAPTASRDTVASGDGGKLHAAEAPSADIVFRLRSGKIVAVSIGTGLTDQDYTEVTSGLTDRDTVLVLSGTTP